MKVIFAFSLRGFSAFSALLFSLVSYRLLDKTEAGVFFFCLSLVMVLSLVARIGLDTVVVRFVSRSDVDASVDKGKVFSCVFFFVLFISSVVSFLVWFFSLDISNLFLEGKGVETVRVMALSITAYSLLSVVSFYNQGTGKYYYSIIFLNIGVYFFSLLFAFFGDVNDSVSLACVFMASLVANLALSLFFSSPVFCFFDKELFSRLIKVGLSLWVVSFLVQYLQMGATIFSGFFLGPDLAGVINAAQRLALSSSFILMAINLVYGRKFAKATGDEYVGLISGAVRISILVASPVFLVLFLFPGFFMGLFGGYYSDYGYVLIIFLLGQVVNVATGPCLIFLSVTGAEKQVRDISFLILLLSFAAFWAGGKFGGDSGLAVATSFLVIVQNLLLFFVVLSKMDLTFLGFLKSISGR